MNWEEYELWQCPKCKTVRAISIKDGYISCNECKATMKLIFGTR